MYSTLVVMLGVVMVRDIAPGTWEWFPGGLLGMVSGMEAL